MTSRYRGDDAVPCSQGDGDCTQHQTVSYQGSHLATHPPADGWFRVNESHGELFNASAKLIIATEKL